MRAVLFRDNEDAELADERNERERARKELREDSMSDRDHLSTKTAQTRNTLLCLSIRGAL